jgi:hypothetical protein
MQPTCGFLRSYPCDALTMIPAEHSSKMPLVPRVALMKTQQTAAPRVGLRESKPSSSVSAAKKSEDAKSTVTAQTKSRDSSTPKGAAAAAATSLGSDDSSSPGFRTAATGTTVTNQAAGPGTSNHLLDCKKISQDNHAGPDSAEPKPKASTDPDSLETGHHATHAHDSQRVSTNGDIAAAKGSAAKPSPSTDLRDQNAPMQDISGLASGEVSSKVSGNGKTY